MDAHDTQADAQGSRAALRLPQRSQLAILAAIAALIAAVVLVRPAGPALPPAASSGTATESNPSSGFKPTAQQWAGFKIVTVEERIFRDAHNTDGKIALDDDLTTPVYSPYSGRVTRLFARAGDAVRQGDPLFAIAASEFVQGQNDLISAVATLRTAQAQLNLARTNEKRQHDLYLAQGGSLKDWQQSQVDLATAQGGLHSAEIAVGAVRNRLRILGKSDREIDAIENATDLQQISDEAIVGAPISGTITQRQIGLGQNIVGATASSGASGPVFSIGDLSKVWLVANAREVDAPALHVGDPVEVRVLAFPGRVFRARLTYVAPSIDPTIHRLPVRAEVENSDGELKPEMFASFRIITGAGQSAPGVPEEAVVYEGQTAHVWVADDTNKTVAIRQIRVGRVTDGFVEVLDGLKPGEKVVTAGALFIDRAVAGD
jgi:cobalt-zinc-cadmium efflux system membrane fusion protein